MKVVLFFQYVDRSIPTCVEDKATRQGRSQDRTKISRNTRQDKTKQDQISLVLKFGLVLSCFAGKVFETSGDLQYPQYFAHFEKRIRSTYPKLKGESINGNR